MTSAICQEQPAWASNDIDDDGPIYSSIISDYRKQQNEQQELENYYQNSIQTPSMVNIISPVNDKLHASIKSIKKLNSSEYSDDPETEISDMLRSVGISGNNNHQLSSDLALQYIPDEIQIAGLSRKRRVYLRNEDFELKPIIDSGENDILPVEIAKPPTPSPEELDVIEEEYHVNRYESPTIGLPDSCGSNRPIGSNGDNFRLGHNFSIADFIVTKPRKNGKKKKGCQPVCIRKKDTNKNTSKLKTINKEDNKVTTPKLNQNQIRNKSLDKGTQEQPINTILIHSKSNNTILDNSSHKTSNSDINSIDSQTGSQINVESNLSANSNNQQFKGIFLKPFEMYFIEKRQKYLESLINNEVD